MDEVILSRIIKEAYEKGYADGSVEGYNLAAKHISPQRKKGKWEVYGEYKQTIDGRTFDGWCECSNCRIMYRYEFQSLNFCPNCGADLREGSDEE